MNWKQSPSVLEYICKTILFTAIVILYILKILSFSVLLSTPHIYVNTTLDKNAGDQADYSITFLTCLYS